MENTRERPEMRKRKYLAGEDAKLAEHSANGARENEAGNLNVCTWSGTAGRGKVLFYAFFKSSVLFRCCSFFL